jgi:hypothetical protein
MTQTKNLPEQKNLITSDEVIANIRKQVKKSCNTISLYSDDINSTVFFSDNGTFKRDSLTNHIKDIQRVIDEAHKVKMLIELLEEKS